MRASTQRLTSAAESLLAPGESLESTGVGWAAPTRPKVPLLFLGRRQHWFALTDRRMLVFARHRGGPRAEDLILGKRYSSYTLEKVHRHRLLFQVRIRGANDARLVLEFRPGHRALAADLVARLTRALPAGEAPSPPPGDADATSDTPATDPPTTDPPTTDPPTTDASASDASASDASAAAEGSDEGVDRDTAAAFWGDS